MSYQIDIIHYEENGQVGRTTLIENTSLKPNDQPNLKRIILVQLPKYVKHIQPDDDAVKVLKDELSIIGLPEAIVNDHIANEQNSMRFTENFRTPRSPSILTPGESFTVTYYEARTYDGEWNESTRASLLNPTTGEFELICASTGHQVQLHEWHEELSRGPLMMVPRNCSFWCRKLEHGNWDGKFSRLAFRSVLISRKPLPSSTLHSSMFTLAAMRRH
jgi:hypothetical protein